MKELEDEGVTKNLPMLLNSGRRMRHSDSSVTQMEVAISSQNRVLVVDFLTKSIGSQTCVSWIFDLSRTPSVQDLDYGSYSSYLSTRAIGGFIKAFSESPTSMV